MNIWRVIVKIKGFLKKLNDDCIDAYSAQAAFFIMLSFITFIILLLSLLKYVPVSESEFIDMATEAIPLYIKPIIVTIIEEAYNHSAGFLSISIVAAIWSSAKGFLSLNKGLNRVYNVEETRNYIILRIRACVLTLILVLSIILSLGLIVFGNYLQSRIDMYLPIISVIVHTILKMKAIYMPIIFVTIFVIIYTVIPNRKMRIRNQIPGALICAAAWYGFSFFFSIYVEYSSNLSKMYGSLTTLILAMLWLYFCMYIILICAEINSYFEDYFAKLKLSKLKKKFDKIEKKKNSN